MLNPQTVDFAHTPSPGSLWSLGTTPVTVPQTASLQEVITCLGGDSLQQHSCILVMQGHQLVGLVTDRHAIRLLASGVALGTPICQHMTELLTVLPIDTNLNPLDVLDLMRQQQIHYLPLVDADQRPVRLITARSLLQSDLLYNLDLQKSLDLQELQPSLSQLWHTLQPPENQSDSEQIELRKNHNSELERLVQGRTVQLEEQAKCDRLLTTLTQRIHQSLDVQTILSTTVLEVRQLLQADRVLVYRFENAASGTVVVEAVVAPWPSLLGHTIEDHCFAKHWAEAYRYGRIQTVEDVERSGLSPCHIAMLKDLQIRANLVVPIVCDQQLWGLLVINQCAQSRRWRDWEIRLVEQLARSVAIAVRQSELYQQIQADLDTRKQYELHLQQLNDELEQRVEARTASWQQVTQKLRQEVDQHRYAEHALAKANQQLQAVLDAVPAMVSWVSAEGRYLGCNHHLAESFQLTPADFIGQPLGFLGESSPFCGFAQRFLQGSAEINDEQITFAMNDRVSHWLLVAQKYDQGSAAVFVGLDISDREQVKAALQTSELKFRSLVEQTNDWMWEIDSQLRFSYINPRATEILGYPAEKILTYRFTDFMSNDEAVRFSTLLTLPVGQIQPFTQFEANCQRPSGETVTLEISGSPIFNAEGEFQGYRGITRDITERKQVEVDIRKALTRQKELTDLKTRFISIASHEFRTPLTTILASAETLERYSQTFTPEKQHTVLKRIQTSVHQMITLLNDVLTVGKAETGKFTCVPTPMDLQQFCRDLVEEVQVAQPDPAVCPIELTYQGDRASVLADEKLLRHTLLNLLSNAVKYSPDYSPVVFTVAVSEVETVFQVSDRGIGIPVADQAQLFNTFHRAENVGNISGTGLGLVIAKRAAEAHQGRLSFVSKVGVGTTFTVVLPHICTE